MRPDLSLLRSRQGGFGLVAAMFVIVVVAAVAGAIGFLLRDSELFEEWLLTEREAHQRELAGVLERLVSEQLAAAVPEPDIDPRLAGPVTVTATVWYSKIVSSVADYLGVPAEEAEAVEMSSHSTTLEVAKAG